MTASEPVEVPHVLIPSAEEKFLDHTGPIKSQWVYGFQEAETLRREQSYGSDEMKSLLGGKGANLVEMTRLGLPIPPGFTVTTEACRSYLTSNGTFPFGL
jgi:hypothetical protein